MGITTAEFRTAMETYGARRLVDRKGSRANFPVPCFAIGDVVFFHSGTYYVVHRGAEVPEETMNRAMAELGEEHPGGENYWYGEIHSIRGMITFALMLEDKYSKEFADDLTNETYKKLLGCPLIQEPPSSKMEELHRLVAQFDVYANPYANGAFELKEPIEYLDKLDVTIACREGDTVHAHLIIMDKESRVETTYWYEYDGWRYEVTIPTLKNGKKGYISLGHYYTNNMANQGIDEVISLDYSADNEVLDHPDDIEFRISLNDGSAWRTYGKEKHHPATDEQIDLMLKYLNIAIQEVQQRIICHMIDD